MLRAELWADNARMALALVPLNVNDAAHTEIAVTRANDHFWAEFESKGNASPSGPRCPGPHVGT